MTLPFELIERDFRLNMIVIIVHVEEIVGIASNHVAYGNCQCLNMETAPKEKVKMTFLTR